MSVIGCILVCAGGVIVVVIGCLAIEHHIATKYHGNDLSIWQKIKFKVGVKWAVRLRKSKFLWRWKVRRKDSVAEFQIVFDIGNLATRGSCAAYNKIVTDGTGTIQRFAHDVIGYMKSKNLFIQEEDNALPIIPTISEVESDGYEPTGPIRRTLFARSIGDDPTPAPAQPTWDPARTSISGHGNRFDADSECRQPVTGYGSSGQGR